MAEDVKDVEDVKETEESSTSDPVEEAADSSEEQATKEDELAYEDIVETKDRKIPYHVFKERNDKLRSAERELKELKAQFNEKITDEVSAKEAELKKAYEDELFNQSSYTDTAIADPKVKTLESTIESLKAEISDIRTESTQRSMRNEVRELGNRYPFMDTEHVYAIKRARPEWDLEQCAEYSHNRFEKHGKATFEKMLEKKKAAASQKKVIGPESFKNMKDDEKPKTWEGVRSKLRQYYGEG